MHRYIWNRCAVCILQVSNATLATISHDTRIDWLVGWPSGWYPDVNFMPCGRKFMNPWASLLAFKMLAIFSMFFNMTIIKIYLQIKDNWMTCTMWIVSTLSSSHQDLNSNLCSWVASVGVESQRSQSHLGVFFFGREEVGLAWSKLYGEKGMID